MPTIPPRHIQLLKEICNLPTAPYHEHHVIHYLQNWATSLGLNHWQDRAKNLYIEYRRGPKHKKPLIIEAHLDHPGFLATKQRGQKLHAEFHGAVRPSHFKNAPVQFLINTPPKPGGYRRRGERLAAKSPLDPHPSASSLPHEWLPAKVLSAKPRKNSRTLDIQLQTPHKIPPGSLGMWHLPDADTKGPIFRARVCDDLATVAATCALFEQLLAQKQPAHVIAMFDRAEEVGFAGVIAACQSKSFPGATTKGGARVIGLETSKALPTAKQGDGVVIRVGDRTGLFSPGLTHFLSQSAGHLSDDPKNKSFKSQRKLMDAGMCNSTPFTAWQHDTAALCLPLGNYHNMHIKNDPGYQDAPTAGKHKLIANETIHLEDFQSLIHLLFETIKRLPTYKENFLEIKHRLIKMHHQDHLSTLYK